MKIPAKYGWTFQTKLEQAADLVLLAAETLQFLGKKQLWVVTDGALRQAAVRARGAGAGGHAGRPAAEGLGAVRPAAGGEDQTPRPQTHVWRQPPLVGQACGASPGWIEVPCTVYGQVVIKRVKTFVATHRTFGGAIRVVIVQEHSGPQFFYCTDVNRQLGRDPRGVRGPVGDRAGVFTT